LPKASYAQSFGKVFSTPQERLYLDRERENALKVLSEQERLDLLDAPPTVQTPLLVEPKLIHMGGSVRRSDGNHTIWLNGVAVSQSDLPSNARLEFVRGLGVLKVQGLGREYIVKPGQTLNADSGDIREDYELSEEELERVNARVVARDLAAQQARANSTSSQPKAEVEQEPITADDNKSLITDIVEGLQLLQQARDLRDSVQ
tara:strand:+ start:28965 stop:29573 length:609 start_codon:yes stop_codon:yes gene_type:complete